MMHVSFEYEKFRYLCYYQVSHIFIIIYCIKNQTLSLFS